MSDIQKDVITGKQAKDLAHRLTEVMVHTIGSVDAQARGRLYSEALALVRREYEVVWEKRNTGSKAPD